MVMSVNTNIGAMVALQNLNMTNRDMEEVQNRINTGYKVAGPKDDGAIYAIAQNMRGEVGGFQAVRTALNNSISIVDVAISAGQAVSDLLIEMKEKSVAALDQSLNTASRNALNADFVALADQISNIVNNAAFNGTNLIDGSSTQMTVLANPDGTSLTVTGQDMSASNGLGITASMDLSTFTSSQDALAAINTAMAQLNQDLGLLGTRSKSLDVHGVFVGKLIDSLVGGIGNLVDADLAAESAHLQSLQIKQQLGIQALSIANAAPQNILSLFQ